LKSKIFIREIIINLMEKKNPINSSKVHSNPYYFVKLQEILIRLNEIDRILCDCLEFILDLTFN
jgi:hypothetical protein